MGSKKNTGLKFFLDPLAGPKNFSSKKYGSKEFWFKSDLVHKNYDPKNWVQKVWSKSEQ